MDTTQTATDNETLDIETGIEEEEDTLPGDGVAGDPSQAGDHSDHDGDDSQPMTHEDILAQVQARVDQEQEAAAETRAIEKQAAGILNQKCFHFLPYIFSWLAVVLSVPWSYLDFQVEMIYD